MKYKLEMKNIEKGFPGVKALSNVSMQILPGEVFVLLGENGAGKSTLMKILAGVYSKDLGEIIFKGKKVQINNTKDAEKLGIYMIYQELNLVPDISVAENIFLGREPKTKLGFIDHKKMYMESKEILKEMNLHINPKSLIKDLSMAQCQMIEISRALIAEAEVIIMDEPTAAITKQETDELFRQIKSLKVKDVSIIYISHRLPEIMEIGDRIFIMRDGMWIDTVKKEETDTDSLVRMMVGREIGDLYPKEKVRIGKELLRVENINHNNLKDISFSVHAGEVLGWAGLMGAGRTEVMRVIFGADGSTIGDIFVKGEKVNIKKPQDAVRNKIAFVTEDRKNTGIIAGMPVDINITLSSLKKYSELYFIKHDQEELISKKYIEDLKIKTPSVNTDIATLSGGNQQKAILARWLCTEADVIILDEPTRGIDVGAKREIYLLINQLAANGKAVILVSSDLPEVLGMSDRIIVMSEGIITGELDASSADQFSVMKLATKGVSA